MGMIAFLKIIIMLAILFLLAYPMLPFRSKARRYTTLKGLSYSKPHQRKNIFFTIVLLVEFVVFAILFSLIASVSDAIVSIPLLGSIFESIPNQVEFSATVIVTVVLMNLLMLYGFVIFGGVTKSCVNASFGLASTQKRRKKKKKGGFFSRFKRKKKGKVTPTDSEQTQAEADEEQEKEDEEEHKKRLKFRIPFFRRKEEDPEEKKKGDKKEDPNQPEEEDPWKVVPTLPDAEEHPILRFILEKFFGIFFRGPDYRYARKWAIRVRSVLQFFIFFTEIAYLVAFAGLLTALFFSVPKWMYTVLQFIVEKMYIYPFLSIMFLQVVCDFLNAEIEQVDDQVDYVKEEEKKQEGTEDRLYELQTELLRRFAKEHCIRLFPEAGMQTTSEYVCTNKTYAGALSYIRNHMEASSEHVVQSHMKGLDALFNGEHAYFSSSFYSELGEYLIAYTYIRLLAGQRQIFVVSDRQKVDSLKKYIGRRLNRLTGTSDNVVWRVRGADGRLDQTDVLIAVPEDFQDDNMIEHFPGFFEEVCNAIFIDADRTATLNSYLCTVMAVRLQKATDNRIRFIFLTDDVLQGFGKSLKKLFTIREDIAEFSSAEENESVAYWLWNRESPRIYQRNGQRLFSLEDIIAEEAYQHEIDGIRILTSAPFDTTDRRNLMEHHVEINEFHRDVPYVNYLVCTDNRCNLPAALYAYTRYRGRFASVVHILTKPYLLREYFVATIDQYVNRSSFIQPRVPENVDNRRLSLLRIFCDATGDDGMPTTEFVTRVTDVIKQYANSRTTPYPSMYCFNREEEIRGNLILTAEEARQSFHFKKGQKEFSLQECVSYLLAGLTDGASTEEADSKALNKTLDYYILTNSNNQDNFSLVNVELIHFTRVKDIFADMMAEHKRVELLLDDHCIGYLDTFPSRVYQQYIQGQSIVFNNKEYEIADINKEEGFIRLSHENATFNNCLDTIHLRRYRMRSALRTVGNEGALHFTVGPLSWIKTELQTGKLTGETYGFYSLMTDRQALDFVEGAQGNPHLTEGLVNAQHRELDNARVLSVKICSNADAPCNDEMRLLLAAVLNEFIKTMYPDVCDCIAVCPVLETPQKKDDKADTFEQKVKTVYPYLYAGEIDPQDAIAEIKEEKKNIIHLLIINDSEEDVGVLEKLFDSEVRILHEMLAHIYGYLNWLKQHPELPEGQKHYIYFGGDTMPACFDLEGLCHLLQTCTKIYSERGKQDINSADLVETKMQEETCAFCHSTLERGRYMAFDKRRYVCFTCMLDAVSRGDELQEQYSEVVNYWKNAMKAVPLPAGVTVKFMRAQEFRDKPFLSEHSYRVDTDNRVILVEKDLPKTNVKVAILCGLIALWQFDNKFIVPESMAQLYHEELQFLIAMGLSDMAEKVKSFLHEELKKYMEEILAHIAEAPETNTSFTYIAGIVESRADHTPEGGEEQVGGLYDPDRIPRFFKRYLRGEKLEGSTDEIPTDAKLEDEEGDADPTTEDGEEENIVDTPTSNEETEEESKKKPKQKKIPGFKSGIKLVPHEPDEKTNPAIYVYNEIARRAADFSDAPIDSKGLSAEEINRVFQYVMCDYPEFFWVDWYGRYSNGDIGITFRCLDNQGKVDIKQIRDKRNAIRKAAKPFVKGITKKTKPYDALLTIYRRLVLTLDYDGVGLDAGEGQDTHFDDNLRSLYSALVTHKVVCAGYAVAMEYLLHMVGIPCGYVRSEVIGNGGHAFNAVKLGDSCYYLDATWGDNSNTKTGDDRLVQYSYVCTPLSEFILASDEEHRTYHHPRAALYPQLEEFTSKKFEYFRYHGAFLDRYDEEKIVHAMVKFAVEYDPKEMGKFAIGFRFCDESTMRMVMEQLIKQGKIWAVIKKATEGIRAEKKKHVQYIDTGALYRYEDYNTHTVLFFFEN